MRVARAPDAVHIGLKGRAFAAHFDAVCSHQCTVDLFADGGDDKIARNFHKFACADRCTASGYVRLAKTHFLAAEHTVFLRDRSRQLEHLDALVDGELQLMFVGGHFLLRAAIDDGRALCAHALGDARRVHRRVARAYDRYMTG